MTSPRDGRTTTIRGRGNSSTGGSVFGNAGASGSVASTASSTGSAGAGVGRGGVQGVSGGRGGMAGAGSVSMRLAGIESRLSLMEMGARAGQISFTSLLDGDLRVTDLLGEVKMKIGMQSDGKPGISYATGVAPPVPSMPAVSARQLYIVVGWDGDFADSVPRPSDLARVDVHVSNEQDFEPSGLTAVGSLFNESVCVIPADIEDHWVRLVAVTLGDVPSPPTEPILVRPLPADKIAAESIAAVHLASEIILSSTIVAGNPRGAHMELNETGLRMVREDGTPTVVFSADEGNALITGSIQTALRSSGKSRIVFNPFPGDDVNAIRFYAPNDASFSTLFSSRDRNGRDGAIALQGPYTSGAERVLSVNLGEASLLAGVFNIVGATTDGTAPFSDGLLASPNQTALVGGGGPFLVHNYKRPTPTASPGPGGTQDPFIAFTDTPTSAFNGHSVLEFHENEDLLGYRWASIRNLGMDLMFKFGDGQFSRFACKDYDNSKGTDARIGYVPIAVAGLADLSSRDSKTDISDLDQHVDPLEVITGVRPSRFRRIGIGGGDEDRTMWMPDPVPPNPSADVLAALDADLAEAREHKTEDGLIPIPVGPRLPRGPERPTYGLIAEEIAPLAPDAIVPAGDGVTPMLDHGALIALVWGAVARVNERLDELSEQVNQPGEPTQPVQDDTENDSTGEDDGA